MNEAMEPATRVEDLDIALIDPPESRRFVTLPLEPRP